jgi:hypothetical protein
MGEELTTDEWLQYKSITAPSTPTGCLAIFSFFFPGLRQYITSTQLPIASETENFPRQN